MIRQAKIEDAGRIAEINVAGWRYACKDFVSEEILYREFLVENSIKSYKKMIEEKWKKLGYQELVIWALKENLSKAKYFSPL